MRRMALPCHPTIGPALAVEMGRHALRQSMGGLDDENSHRRLHEQAEEQFTTDGAEGIGQHWENE